MEQAIETKHLPPLVYKASAIRKWTVVIGIVLIPVFWWAFDLPVLSAAFSVIVVCIVVHFFIHRNDRITLTEQGIGLDRVRVFEGRKKVGMYDHVDLKWQDVSKVELHYVYWCSFLWVFVHDKKYFVNTEFYSSLDVIKFKSWRKTIEEYGNVPCTLKYF